MKTKQIFLSILFLTVSFVANAQWTKNGSNVYYNATNGKVGIGTSSPGYELDVRGMARADNFRVGNIIGRDLNSVYNFTYDGVTIQSFSLGWVEDPKTDPKANGYALWMSGFAGIKFFTYKHPVMTLTMDGKVGIGTETPTHKLSVDGSIKAREVLVSAAGWADFVFEDNYELPSLEEVRSHISEKGHLPGIPSAKEVEENGIGLAEMNVKLLQKIEEQTLYILELSDRIQQLENNAQNVESK